jgi:hypothetical protein
MTHEIKKLIKEAEEILKRNKGKPEPKFKFKEYDLSKLNKLGGTENDGKRK